MSPIAQFAKDNDGEGAGMTEANQLKGRERREHDRFVIKKRVELSTSTEKFDGVLRDISVGGAAIQVRAPLYEAHIVSIDINDLGAYEGQILRSIDEDLYALEFETTEQQSIDLAAKLVGIYYGAGAEPVSDINDIEKYNLTP